MAAVGVRKTAGKVVAEKHREGKGVGLWIRRHVDEE
jgi:hypothetical protein